MIKIFYNDKSIFLSDKEPISKAENKIAIHKVTSGEECFHAYSTFIKNKELEELHLIGESSEHVFRDFVKSFQYIEAAGGLVNNNKQQFLFIYRLGKWDLPKGKVEKGETNKIAAIREVEEECGIGQLEITKELASTYHIYTQKDTLFLKRTYWFKMHCNDTDKLTPQQEEGITDVKWMRSTDLQTIYDNTYASIKDVLQELE